MSTATRRTILTCLVTIVAIYVAIGLVGALARKLDLGSTLFLIISFVVFSTGITWLQVWDDRKTRGLLVRIAAQLAPYDLEINVRKGGFYEIVGQGEPFEEIVSDELDLDGLEAFIAGLHHGTAWVHASHDDGRMEAKIVTQEAQDNEDRAHIGVDGSYIWRIPGMEE